MDDHLKTPPVLRHIYSRATRILARVGESSVSYGPVSYGPVSYGPVSYGPVALNPVSGGSAFLSALLFCCVPFMSSGCAPSESSAIAVEREASTATFQWLDEQYGVVRSAEASALTDRIASRLDRAIVGRSLEAKFGANDCGLSNSGDYVRYPWQVFILHAEDPNAFSVGAGVIFVTSGLVTQANSESELAAVIAHEMSHQLLGHTREAILEHSESLKDESHQHGPEVPRATFDLDQEMEADALSVRLLIVARYEPQAAVRALLIGHRTSSGGFASDGTSSSSSLCDGSVPDCDSRTQAESVANREWLDKREAALHERLSGCSDKLPALESTREFRRVRRLIAGGA